MLAICSQHGQKTIKEERSKKIAQEQIPIAMTTSLSTTKRVGTHLRKCNNRTRTRWRDWAKRPEYSTVHKYRHQHMSMYAHAQTQPYTQHKYSHTHFRLAGARAGHLPLSPKWTCESAVGCYICRSAPTHTRTYTFPTMDCLGWHPFSRHRRRFMAWNLSFRLCCMRKLRSCTLEGNKGAQSHHAPTQQTSTSSTPGFHCVPRTPPNLPQTRT